MTDQSILMMAHGSRDSEARAEYRRIHEAMAARLAPTPVQFTVLEFPRDDGLPSIEAGWRSCVASGSTRIVALPYFLFPAGHVREDLPSELRAARETAGWAEVEFVPPLGPADEILETVDTRAQEALASLPDADATRTAVILVGAGTSDPDANGDLCKAARLLWERFNERYGLVEAAWVSLTRPSIAEAVDRCLKLGAMRIALVPYFLNTGILLKRIDEQLAAIRSEHPGVQAARSAHFGLHPRMLDLLERRAREGLAQGVASDGLLAVCGRASCASVAKGRSSLLQLETAERSVRQG
jgi:sirohydrochlorin cobaltochelatase